MTAERANDHERRDRADEPQRLHQVGVRDQGHGGESDGTKVKARNQWTVYAEGDNQHDEAEESEQTAEHDRKVPRAHVRGDSHLVIFRAPYSEEQARAEKPHAAPEISWAFNMHVRY